MDKKTGFWGIFVGLGLLFFGVKSGWADFSPEPYFTLDIPSPYYLETGDLNNDGKPDLAVSSWFRLPVSGEQYDKDKTRIYVFYNKGGEYKPPTEKEIITVTDPWTLKIGDFDQDGKNDLCVIGEYLYLHLLFGKEDFSIDHKYFDVNQYYRSLSIGKIGNEGITDFLVGPTRRKWLGGDKFQNWYFYGPTKNDNDTPVLCDLNQDGTADIIFTTKENIIRIFYGPIPNMDVKPADVSAFIQLTTPFPVGGIAVADLNGDGRSDIVASGAKGVLIYYQNAPIGFTDKNGPSATIEGTTGLIAAVDLNKDGLSDLVVAENNRQHPKIYIFYQKKEKPFAKNIEEADQILDTKDVFPNYCLKVTDINGDGFPELITGTPHGINPGIIRGFLNKGNK